MDCAWLSPTSASSHCSPSCGGAQQPDLGADTKEVREVLAALKAESEAAKAAAAAPPAADQGGAPSNVALSLACIGCARRPGEASHL